MKQDVTVYLIHFDSPYRHARHYIGVTDGDINERIARHRAGNGARLIQVIQQAGITWRLAKIWEHAPRQFERALKARKGAHRFCPVCLSQSEGAHPVVVRYIGSKQWLPASSSG